MDPITLILTALAAGAGSGVKDAAASAVKDAYAGLKALVKKRFAGRPEVELVLAKHEDAPQTWQAPLAVELSETGAGRDAELVAAAQALMALVDEAGSRAGKYTVDVHGAQAVQVGEHGVQENKFIGQYVENQVVQAQATQVKWPVLVGDVPQQPPAFQPRAALLAALAERRHGVAVVHAVTGMRGVGKTQVAAAYARSRMVAGWRLVAWVNAGDTAKVLNGLGEVAARLGIGDPGEDLERAAAAVRHWLEANGVQCLLIFDNAANLDGCGSFRVRG